MNDELLDPLEQRQIERAQRTGKTIQFEGETLQLRASVAPEAFIFQQGMDDAQLVESLDRRALMCIHPASHDAWKRLRDPEREMPLSPADVIWLVNHLLAEVSGIPTDRPVDSSTGPQPTNGSSKAKSSSKAAARKG